MTDILYIRPEDSRASQWRWCVIDEAGDRRPGNGTLADAAGLAPGRRVVLLVPGERVLLTRVRVPLRARTRAAAAVPWALEDRLVADVETLHFALGSLDAEGEWSVAAVEREYLETCLHACTEAGLAPHVAVPEPLALPLPEAGGWTALEEGDRVICRTGPATGFACAPPLLPAVCQALETPDSVVVQRAGEPVAWPAPVDGRLQVGDPLDDPMPAFAAAPDRDAIDLLQGPYSRRERIGRVWRRWRAPAALAAVLLALLLVNWAVAYRELGQRQQALQAAAEQILRAAVPDVGRVVDPRVQLKNRLDALRGDAGDDETGLLTLLERTGPVLAKRRDVTLTGLDWRNRTLDLSVEAKELQVVDGLQRDLQDAGLTVELRGVQRQDETVRGEVRVEAPAA
ncbi:MAG: type II secretion system protein GspL [Halofilum sp. (in: g-proteobacteria)]|nr:type II secretion system protein GspL [Halofilum sp. (in: g-proteobacteria)]